MARKQSAKVSSGTVVQNPGALIALLAAALVTAVYALYKLSARGDEGEFLPSEDGPIRVKGGSVTIEGPQNWVAAPGQPYRLAVNNSRLHDAVVDVTLEGVTKAPSQVHGRVVHIDVIDPGDETLSGSQLTIAVAGGVAVTNSRLEAAGKKLTSTDSRTFMSQVQVLGGARPSTFGPYTKEQSKNLIITIQPL